MWGPYASRWRQCQRETKTGSARSVGLARRRRRPPPESVTDLLIRTFFVGVLFLFLVPLVLGLLAFVAPAEPETFVLLVVGLTFGYWLVRLWSMRIPWQRRLFLTLVSASIVAAAVLPIALS